jgi:hypothetical protein
MRAFGIVAVGVASVALAGCGGSDSKSGRAASAPSTTAATTQATPPPVASAPAPQGKSKSKPLTKPRYIARADKICTVARARLIPLRAQTIAAAKGADPNLVFKRYATLTGQAADVYSGALGQLEALGAPAADQSQIDTMNQLVGQIASIERQISRAAATHDTAGIKTLNVAVIRATESYRSLAHAYGLNVCGKAAAAQLNRRGNR